MSTVDEIKAAINDLPESQQAELASWLLRRGDDAWDRQMAEDIDLGKLSEMIRKAESDIAEGRLRDLPGIGPAGDDLSSRHS